jgi:tetratricopeptide (TPR) repeat protein
VQSLAQAYPSDKEVLRAEAATYEAKGESLSQSGDPQASASALQTAVHIYDKVVARPGVTPELIFEAAIAYETLGNEEGEDTGLADTDAATAAYHRALDMDNLALKLKPNYLAVRRGIPLMHIHLGNVVLETAPDQALSEFRLALQLQEALPDDQRKKLTQVRLHATLLRKIGQAFTELGMYQEAQSALDSAFAAYQRLYDADPRNVAALTDVWRSQDALALCNEAAGNPDLQSTSPAERNTYRLAAVTALSQEIDTVRKQIQLTASHEEWDQELASLLIRRDTLKYQLGLPYDSATATQHSLQVLLHAAQGPKAAASDIAAAVDSELNAQPTSVRDLKAALSLAKAGFEMTHHREAEYLLLLARAYRANGDQAKAIKAATEGLALRPVTRPGEPVSHLRKLLTVQLARR